MYAIETPNTSVYLDIISNLRASVFQGKSICSEHDFTNHWIYLQLVPFGNATMQFVFEPCVAYTGLQSSSAKQILCNHPTKQSNYIVSVSLFTRPHTPRPQRLLCPLRWNSVERTFSESIGEWRWTNSSNRTCQTSLLLLSRCPNVNALWPGDVIWRHWARSTLAQLMACCLTAPSHYLNQCWLIIGEVPEH